MSLSATMLSYLRTIHKYTEGGGDHNTSWTTQGWYRTQVALTGRGLIEQNPHPRRRRDRQSVRLTDAGRDTLVTYEDRKTKVITYRRAWGRRTGYRTVWDEPHTEKAKA